MAIIGARVAIDMSIAEEDFGDIVETTSDRIVLADGEFTYIFSGRNFAFSGSDVVGGTLEGYATLVDGQSVFEISELSVDAALVDDLILAGQLQELFGIGLAGADTVLGSSGDDYLKGFAGDDGFVGGTGVNTIDGGEGADIAGYLQAPRGAFTISAVGNQITVTDQSSIFDTLISIERVAFDDGTLAFDENAIQTFRLYQAAFDRIPDTPGVSFWVQQVDNGVTLRTAAENFISSPEFKGLYGPAPSNEEFIDLLYANVLNRAADQSGYDFWNGQMAGGLSRAEVLVQFSESPENQQQTAADVANGVWLV